MTVRGEQRYTHGRRCPICGGADGDKRGAEKRCFGYLSGDGFAHCTRETYAGSLKLLADESFAHRLTGRCGCGERHEGATRSSTSSARSSSDRLEHVATYDYRDERGVLQYQVVRLVGVDGKTFRQRRPDKSGEGWTWGRGDAPRTLYRLPELLAAPADATVYIVEGEKDVDAMRERGLVAICNPEGAGKWHYVADVARSFLPGRNVRVIADLDEDHRGEKHAEDVASSLRGVAASVRVVKLTAKDASDWFAAGGTVDQLEKLVAATTEAPAEECDDEPKRRKVAQVALEVFAQRFIDEHSLCHDVDGVAYATIRIAGHAETWPIASRELRGLVQRAYYERTGDAVAEQTMREVLAVLDARARFDGPRVMVATRIAEHEGAIYLDLGDERCRAVRIARDGWRVVEAAPVKFRRPRGMRALPEPVSGGSLAELRPFVNVASESDWALVVAWLVTALRPNGPYPVLQIAGEAGSAKSTSTRVLRRLVDPNKADDRGEPKEPRDLMIAAHNGHVIALDNLSGMPRWLSDALCRLSTGAGFATRENYSDLDETIISAARPIIVNGIGEVATADDLLSRIVGVTLEPIADSHRRTEAEFWRAFALASPRVLGALLDAVAFAMRNVDDVRLAGRPRMADFAAWASAAEPKLGLAMGGFMRAYAGSIEDSHASVLENSPIAAALRALLAENRGTWRGATKELLVQLTARVADPPKRWPQNAQGLRSALDRITPALRKVGVRIDRSKSGDRALMVTDDRAASARAIEVRTSSTETRRDSETVDDADVPDDRVPASGGLL